MASETRTRANNLQRPFKANIHQYLLLLLLSTVLTLSRSVLSLAYGRRYIYRQMTKTAHGNIEFTRTAHIRKIPYFGEGGADLIFNQ